MRLWFARDIWRYRNVFWLIDWLRRPPSLYNVVDDYSAWPEIQEALPKWSHWYGSKSTTLETCLHLALCTLNGACQKIRCTVCERVSMWNICPSTFQTQTLNPHWRVQTGSDDPWSSPQYLALSDLLATTYTSCLSPAENIQPIIATCWNKPDMLQLIHSGLARTAIRITY